MQAIRYNIVEKVLDVPLQNPDYPGLFMGSYKTCFGSWVAEHAIIYTEPLSPPGVDPLVRINSACFTGDIFGDRRCDCTEQLFLTMDMVREQGGLIIYHLHHEGRGLGLTAKLSTYKEMAERGVSTFAAMAALTNRNDLRSYGSAVLILNDLGVKRLRLVTNNPNKKFVLEQNGFEIAETVGVISTRPNIRQYLKTKQEEQGHFIDFEMKPPLNADSA
jgi:GTP cyclohydrolase II